MAHEPKQRLRQLQRVMLLIELLYPLRMGASINDLARDVQETFGRMSERTIRRDLEALAQLGIVEKRQVTHRRRCNASGRREVLWVWRDRTNRGKALQSGALQISEGRLV